MRSLLTDFAILLPGRARRSALLLLVLMTVGAGLEALGIGLILPFLAILGDGGESRGRGILDALQRTTGVDDKDSLLVISAAALLAMYVLKNVYLGLLKYYQFRFVFGRQVDVARRLMAVYMASPYEFHLGTNSAQLLRNVTDEVRHVFANVAAAMANATSEILVILVIAGLLIWAEPMAALFSIGVLAGVSGLFYASVRRTTARLGREKQEATEEHIRSVNEGLGSIKELKVLGREAAFLHRFDRAGRTYARAQRFHRTVRELPRLFIETIGIGAILLVVLAALLQGDRRGLDGILPILGLFALAAVRLMPSLNRLIGAGTTIRLFRPAVRVVARDLERYELVRSQRSQARTEMELREALRLDGVRYRYPGAAVEALRGLDLTIRQGESVAFVGSSGAGKTTVVDLLLGLLEPSDGAVLVDGRDIQSDLSGWQSQIGYVPQPVYLLDGTVRENVAFGVAGEDIDEAAVWRALERAALRAFVESLGDGLDTRIGELGARFSGGQRQRLGIARALYRDPPVLVLDEATSALDNETEREITAAIERLSGDKTVITIAHRLSTIEACDVLFLLSQGELVASATYDELMSTNEDFRRLAAAERTSP